MSLKGNGVPVGLVGNCLPQTKLGFLFHSPSPQPKKQALCRKAPSSRGSTIKVTATRRGDGWIDNVQPLLRLVRLC